MSKGCPYGSHRVIEPQGLLPQPAMRIDNTMKLYDNEILIDVDLLNIDSASFTQIEAEAQGDEKKIAEIMLSIVAKRGNTITQSPVRAACSSGGWRQSVPPWRKTPLKWTRLATLVSLSDSPESTDYKNP